MRLSTILIEAYGEGFVRNFHSFATVIFDAETV